MLCFRHHTIQHYKHLLETNMEQADREKEITIEHLADIDRLVNESLQMLARYPELNTKILPLMEDYLVALRCGGGEGRGRHRLVAKSIMQSLEFAQKLSKLPRSCRREAT
jgi:hypothetical protein